jgi:hypothetical protein
MCLSSYHVSISHHSGYSVLQCTRDAQRQAARNPPVENPGSRLTEAGLNLWIRKPIVMGSNPKLPNACHLRHTLIYLVAYSRPSISSALFFCEQLGMNMRWARDRQPFKGEETFL